MTTAAISIADELNTDIAGLGERLGCSVVQVHNGRGAGAGTIWHSDGLLLTNAHVADSNSLRVTLHDGTNVPGKILASDDRLDLAAVGIEATGLPTIEIGESKSLKAGQLVFAMGHPWGVRDALAAGVVIGVGTQWPDLSEHQREWVVVSLKLRPGNSGGPLVDAHGRLVGINSMITGPQVGMAVPVHVAKAFLRDSMKEPTAAG